MDEFSDHAEIGRGRIKIPYGLGATKGGDMSAVGFPGGVPLACPPCHGNCNQGRDCPTDHEPHTIIPLPKGMTLDEWLQRRMPSDNMGFPLALAIVCGILIGVLGVHAWARM